MKNSCCVLVWSAISVIFLLSLNSEASRRICPKSRQFKAECGKTSTTLSFTNITSELMRIAGGYDAQPGDFPSFVSLVVNRPHPFAHSCSGVLIDTDVVLTIANCLYYQDIVSIDVGLGIIPPRLWSSRGVKIHRAKNFCPSAKFETLYRPFGLEYDYGIVKLEKQVQLSDVVQPACLPDRPISHSAQAYSVGVGSMNGFDTRPRVAQVLPVKRVECDPEHRGPTRTCFRSNNPDYKGNSCGDDAGGPTYTWEGNKMVVVSLLSYNIDGVCRKGSVHTTNHADIFKQKEHILELIKGCQGSRVNNLIDYAEDDED